MRAAVDPVCLAPPNCLVLGGGKKGFDDAADKADCTTMYEAGLVLLEKMQVSSYIP